MDIDAYRTKYKEYDRDYHDSFILPKTLNISKFLSNKKSSYIAIEFAVARYHNCFSDFQKYIADNVVLVINNKETILGKNNFIDYWLNHNHEQIETDIYVRHSILYNRVTILESLREKKEIHYFFFRTSKEKITHAVYFILPLKYRGELPPFKFTRNRLKNLITETILAKENKAPCLYCGSLSENLKWYNIHFFWNFSYYKGYVSFCPKCNKVIEQNLKKIDVPENLSFEDKVRLQINSNPFSKKGVKYLHTLDNLRNDINLIFKDLNLIYLPKPFKLGLKYAENHESYFYIYDNHDEYLDYFNFLKVEENEMGAWQAYLLHTAKIKYPTFSQVISFHRNFIFNLYDLGMFLNIESPDLNHLNLKDHLLQPSVEMKGKTAYIHCCYWNDWKGLIRETVQIDFENNKVTKIETIKTVTLMEYHCGIWY